jgi:hypothetical protein
MVSPDSADPTTKEQAIWMVVFGPELIAQTLELRNQVA